MRKRMERTNSNSVSATYKLSDLSQVISLLFSSVFVK